MRMSRSRSRRRSRRSSSRMSRSRKELEEPVGIQHDIAVPGEEYPVLLLRDGDQVEHFHTEHLVRSRVGGLGAE